MVIDNNERAIITNKVILKPYKWVCCLLEKLISVSINNVIAMISDKIALYGWL